MTVMCFGTFDGLHPGHEDYFRQAKELGDRLVVVVGRDKTVEQVKGHAPKQSEGERLAAVQACALVDEARLGHETDRYKVIEEVQPDIILLGYDQTAFTDTLEEELARRGLTIDIRRATAYHPDTYHSSKLYARH